MTEIRFCRCDTPIVTSVMTPYMCTGCGQQVREIPEQLLHTRPLPPFSREPRTIAPDTPSWRICPDCGAENTEHKPKCPRANWNVREDTPPKDPVIDDTAEGLPAEWWRA